MGTGDSLRDLALHSGPPVALVHLHSSDGSVSVQWANPAMTDLLTGSPGEIDVGSPGPLLALPQAARTRLHLAARDLVASHGRTASVQVSTPARGDVWLHLHVPPDAAAPRLPNGTVTAAVMYAQPVATRQPPPTEHLAGRAALVERLGTALLGLRRRPSRVALAVARVRGPEGNDPSGADARETAELGSRVLNAARETDTVVQLAAGRFGVLVDDPAGDGGVTLARRLQTVLRRSPASGSGPVVDVAVLEITDSTADPEVVLGWLEESVLRRAAGSEPLVLPAWGPEGPGGPLPAEPRRSPAPAQIAGALESGRFVLGSRLLRPWAGPLDGSEPAERRTTLLEVGTVDDGVGTPTRVDAPGLAAALDHWALLRVAALDAPGRVVLRLQPVGSLTALGEVLARVVGERPDLDLLLQFPEIRLDEAVAAQQALLDRLPELGVGLAVAAWTGRVGVATLVEQGVDLVELAPRWQDDVHRRPGAAALTGLVAGMRAGRGAAALVVADRTPDAGTGAAFAACGVSVAASGLSAGAA